MLYSWWHRFKYADSNLWGLRSNIQFYGCSLIEIIGKRHVCVCVSPRIITSYRIIKLTLSTHHNDWLGLSVIVVCVSWQTLFFYRNHCFKKTCFVYKEVEHAQASKNNCTQRVHRWNRPEISMYFCNWLSILSDYKHTTILHVQMSWNQLCHLHCCSHWHDVPS